MGLNEFEKLVQRYYEGNCSSEEKERVEKWLNSSELHQENPWSVLSNEEKKVFVDNLYQNIQSTIGGENMEEQQELRPNSLRWLWTTAAAAACIIMGIFVYTSVQKTEHLEDIDARQTWADLLIESGQRKKVTLSDGTKVWLQGGSRLSYPEKFDSTVRLVRMEGEAFFEVSPNKEKPFIVQAAGLETKVLGTSFNIVAFAGMDKKSVSLVEGKLAVRANDAKGSLSSSEEVILSPNEVAIFSAEDLSLSKSRVEGELSAEDFKSGKLHFKNANLDDVLMRVAKAYGITVSFDKEKARKQKINISFALNDSRREVLQNLARISKSGLVWKDSTHVDFTIK